MADPQQDLILQGVEVEESNILGGEGLAGVGQRVGGWLDRMGPIGRRKVSCRMPNPFKALGRADRLPHALVARGTVARGTGARGMVTGGMVTGDIMARGVIA